MQRAPDRSPGYYDLRTVRVFVDSFVCDRQRLSTTTLRVDTQASTGIADRFAKTVVFSCVVIAVFCHTDSRYARFKSAEIHTASAVLI